jgi:hypothetical protein
MSEKLNPAQDAIKAYDKLLITLAGGALALTVGFVKDVVDLRHASDRGYLFVSWGSFALALLWTLFNYYYNIEELAKETEEAMKPESDRKQVASRYHPLRRNAYTAYGSMLLFSLGLMFFIWFLVENIPSAAVSHIAAAQ